MVFGRRPAELLSLPLSFVENGGRMPSPQPRRQPFPSHLARQPGGRLQTDNSKNNPRRGRGGSTMSDDSAILQALLDRMKQGDQAARRQLLDRVCERLRRLANTMLAGSFPALRAHHEL